MERTKHDETVRIIKNSIIIPLADVQLRRQEENRQRQEAELCVGMDEENRQQREAELCAELDDFFENEWVGSTEPQEDGVASPSQDCNDKNDADYVPEVGTSP